MFSDAKKRFLTVVWAIALLSSQPALAAEKNANDVKSDAVVARVNRQEIKYLELEKMRASNPQLSMIPMNILYGKMLRHVVEAKLITDAARKEKLQDTKDFKDAMKIVEEGILQRLYLQKRVGGKPSDEQIVKMYEEYKKANPPSQEVHARHILLKTKEEAVAVIKSLKSKKAKFEELAKKKSIGPTKNKGGDLGWFNKGKMVKEFADAAFALKKGHVTLEPVQTKFGWHVIKLEGRRQGEHPALDKIRPMLEAQYAEKKVTETLDKLLKNGAVKVFDENGKPLQFEELGK
ncbi:MAG: peptidylprolyl isomerase [Alphaproteobacteria bacterium]|nr:peptidylprolyl isomerase [Alphaproteobacteria bacterium]